MANENAKIDKIKLLQSLQNVVNEKITLKDNISLETWLELKKAVYPINNYITTELTIKFIDKLNHIFKNTPDVKEVILENDLQILRDYYGKQNVNSNGYDFITKKNEENETTKISELNKSFPHITAEIKANIPYDGNKYGSSQKTGLTKDVRGLREPEKKQKDKHDPTNDYKFLVVLDYYLGDYDSKKAVEDLIKLLTKNRNEIDVEIVDLENPQKITKEKIYIVMLGFND